MRDRFDHAAAAVTRVVGSPYALVSAALVLVLWAISGPIFGFSDTWQLVINTATTIVTFLMVFVIQASQNRDAKAIHLKLDELLRAHTEARDEFLVIEGATAAELDRREAEMAHVAEQVAREAGHPDAEGAARRAAQRERRSTHDHASKGRPSGAKH
jgi:low affinity Fe/Cu permease